MVKKKKKVIKEGVEKMINEKKELVGKWLEQAGYDLKTAKNSLNSEDYYASVFWSQQAVEKGLKAVWMERGNDLVKTHNLIMLGKNVGLPGKFSSGIESLMEGYINSRYDMMIEEIPAKRYFKTDVDIFIKLAEEVLEWIRTKI